MIGWLWVLVVGWIGGWGLLCVFYCVVCCVGYCGCFDCVWYGFDFVVGLYVLEVVDDYGIVCF